MKRLTLLMLLILNACGPYEVDVTHKIQLDMSNITKYFELMCISENAPDIDLCVDEKVTQFLKMVL